MGCSYQVVAEKGGQIPCRAPYGRAVQLIHVQSTWRYWMPIDTSVAMFLSSHPFDPALYVFPLLCNVPCILICLCLRKDELTAMGAIRFRFKEKSSPTSAVQNIANALGEDEIPPAEVGKTKTRREGFFHIEKTVRFYRPEFVPKQGEKVSRYCFDRRQNAPPPYTKCQTRCNLVLYVSSITLQN